jgi:FAD/FMN-containing dehydrogenase
MNNRVDGPEEPRSRSKEWIDDIFFQNHLFAGMGKLRRRSPRLAKAVGRVVPKQGRVEYVERSDRVFTSPRLVRFNEMEYGFPREHAGAVLRELREWFKTSGLDVGFPIEVRVTAADDIPLSMTSGRASAFVACHVFKGQPYDQYFRGVEGIVGQVGGRPHWGKLHFQTAATLADRYPMWSQFQDVRRRLDPDGMFANAYTDRVLGPA